MINPKTGRMVFANNTGWENAPIREALKAHLGIPCWQPTTPTAPGRRSGSRRRQGMPMC